MANPWVSFRNSSSETKTFVLTVIVLVVIVFGTCIYAYTRIPNARSSEKPQQEKRLSK